MPLTESAFGSTMRRRVTLAMALLSAALLLAIYFATVRTVAESNEQHALDGIVNVTRANCAPACWRRNRLPMLPWAATPASRASCCASAWRTRRPSLA
jgi:hypothetical protein